MRFVDFYGMDIRVVAISAVGPIIQDRDSGEYGFWVMVAGLESPLCGENGAKTKKPAVAARNKLLKILNDG